MGEGRDHVIVLAAGRGVRAGGPKALHPVGGEAWWKVQSRRLARVGLPVVWVVSERVRAGMEEDGCGLAGLALADESAPMFASVLAGVREVQRGVERGSGLMRGVFVLPVDVPAPGAGVFENLAGALGGDPHAVAAIPTFRREHGHPVYVSWAFARECTLHVDGVAEARLDRLIGERRVEVEVEDEGVVVNLNTTADFETWARRHGGGGAAGEQR